MSENKILSTIYEQLRILKQTPRKTIILLKNRSNGELSIAKVQIRNDNPPPNQRTVRHQGKFLLELQGHIGIPTMRWVGKDGVYDVLIIQKLGKTLQELFQSCENRFSIKTVAMLGIKMFKILQNYHCKGFIHRNICPKAFQVGMGLKNSEIYLSDLMESLSYMNRKTNKHIDFKYGQKISMASSFMTMEQLSGDQTSRKTDIQSIILTLIYFVKGSLPWTGIDQLSLPTQKKTEGLLKQMQVSPKKLCKDLPKQFEQMLTTSRNMTFDEQPKYFYFKQQLLRIMFRLNIQNDGLYDWMIKPNSKTKLRPELQRLKVSRDVAGLNFLMRPQDNAILQAFYEPYAQKVEIDEITEKYSSITENRLKTEQLYEQPWETSHSKGPGHSNKHIGSQKHLGKKDKQKCQIY